MQWVSLAVQFRRECIKAASCQRSGEGAVTRRQKAKWWLNRLSGSPLTALTLHQIKYSCNIYAIPRRPHFFSLPFLDWVNLQVRRHLDLRWANNSSQHDCILPVFLRVVFLLSRGFAFEWAVESKLHGEARITLFLSANNLRALRYRAVHGAYVKMSVKWTHDTSAIYPPA